MEGGGVKCGHIGPTMGTSFMISMILRILSWVWSVTHGRPLDMSSKQGMGCECVSEGLSYEQLWPAMGNTSWLSVILRGIPLRGG